MALAPLARADMARPGWTPGDFWSYASPPGGPNATARYDVVRTETVTVGAIAYVCYRTQLELHYAFAGVWENFTGPAWFRVSDLALVLEMANGTIDLPPPSYVITETISFDPPADLLWPLATGSTWTTAGWLNISE